MADAEELREENLANKLEENKESDFVERGTTENEQTVTRSYQCVNEQDRDDFSSENKSSFKIPASLPKDAKPNEPVSAEKKEKAPELRYKVPWWSATPPTETNYNLEVLKNGCIISTLDLNEKAYHVFGRLPLCDVVLEHPSISRYHAIVQYRGMADGDKTLSGFYLYDLGSTHGTVVNKCKIKAKTYYRLKVGHVIKFGGSSRLFILQGPSDDDDDEEENEGKPEETQGMTESEAKVKVGQIFTDEEYESLKKVDTKTSQESEGIDWGFGEDAEEEQIDSEKFQELYSGVEFKDPKKTLRGYYEREGLELDYQVDETGPGHARVYHCRVRLPVDGPNGSAVYAEASVTGRKKDAVRECANEACKMLDAYGLLRQSSHESRKKRQRNLEEDDFYESDEDNFLDRTGTIEKKRLKRMRKVGKDKPEVETYETLLSKLQKVEEEIEVLVKRIQDSEALEKTDHGWDLDDFINTMSRRMDKQTKLNLKRKIVELRKDEERIKKLVALTKPIDLSLLQSTEAKICTVTDVSHDTAGAKKESNEVTGIDKSTENTEDLDVNSGQDKTSTGDQTSTTVEKPNTKSESSPVFAMPTHAVKTASAKTTKISKPAHSRGETGTQPSDTKNVAKPLDKIPTRTQTENERAKLQASGKDTMKTKSSENNLKTVEKDKCYTVPTQWEEANDPNFASWMPPEDQTGDGKTKLNEKYGY